MSHLLRLRRFGPFFWTQALGATNDNLLKGALLVLFTQDATRSAGEVGLLVNLASGLFILPYLLFSDLAGELADRHDKARLIRLTKVWELGLMLLTAAILLSGERPFALIGLLFLMGTQSAFFSPMKYSLLPEHLRPSELVAGNAWLEFGTFSAILLGSLGGSALAAEGPALRWLIALCLVVLAVAGLGTSQAIPTAPPHPSSARRVRLFGTLRLVLRRRKRRVLVLSIAAFWFTGAAYLAQIPLFVRDTLARSPQWVALFLACFAVGIGLGARLAQRLGQGRIDLRQSVRGALGLGLLPCVSLALPALPVALRSYVAAALLVGIGAMGGLYVVPLYAALQRRARATQRGRVIAGSNTLNALAMITAALVAMLALRLGASVPELFAFIAALQLLALVYVLSQERSLRLQRRTRRRGV